MNVKARVIGGGAILAIAMGLLAYHVESSIPRSAERNAQPLEDGAVFGGQIHRGHRGAGVPARAVDPPQFPAGWRASDLDPELLDAVLSRPVVGMDAVLLDLDANAEMVPWLNSLVSDDEVGQAVAECRRTHERRQRGRCNWDQDVVVRRDPAGETSVVAVRPRTLPGEPDDQSGEPMTPECQSWAKCVADAWKGRAGIFPHGAEHHATTADDGSMLIAVRAGVHHLEAYGKGFADYQATYEDGMARLEEKIRLREQAYGEAEDEGIRTKNAREGLYHNLLLERGRVEDYRAYLAYLREHGP